MAWNRAGRVKPPWPSSDHALSRPRSYVWWLVRFRKRLGLPEPDPSWRSTQQVNWYGDNGFVPGLLTRIVCLYFGHDMRERKVRENGDGGDTHRRDCARCGWEGPWTGTFAPSRPVTAWNHRQQGP